MKKVLGFGACMISGSPFDEGFLHLATQDRCTLVIRSFGGCTIERAAKHFARALSKNPYEIVVVQFGAIDANIDLLLVSKLRRTSGQVGLPSTSPQSPSRFSSPLRWTALDLLSLISKHQTLSLDKFLSTMEFFAKKTEAENIQLVVVSPFISGPRFKNRRAALYKDELAKLLTNYSHTIFVDAFTYLEQFKKRKVLMHNGFHLSRYGHELVSKIVSRKLEALL